MKKGLAFLLVLFAVLPALGLNVSRATPAPDISPIYIRPDGSIEPSTASIQHNGNIYTLTDNIQNCNITVQCDNIIFDGAGFNLQGPGMGVFNLAAISLNCSSAIIINFNIFSWNIGVLGALDSNTIQSNHFSNNYQDIAVYANNYKIIGNQISAERIVGNNNTISQNQITVGDHETAFWITNCHGLKIESNNITFSKSPLIFISTQISDFQVYHNNFLNIENLTIGTLLYPKSPNAKSWDNGVEGNYWSDYAKRYPQAIENDHSGVRNIIYVGAATSNIVDRYPLIKPYNFTLPTSSIPEFSWLTILPLLLATPIAIAIVRKRLQTNV